MRMVNSARFLIPLVLLIAACSPQPKGEWISSAPKTEAQLGLIIDQASESEIAKLIESGVLSARLLNRDSGTFEIYGIEQVELESLLRVKASKNQFWTFESNDLISDQITATQDHLEITGVSTVHQWNLGAGVKVAVIDTGFDVNHPELESKLSTNFAETEGNGLDDDGNGLVDDVSGWNFAENNSELKDVGHHGTSVASIIVSNQNGIAPLSELLPIKVMSQNRRIDEATVIAALKYAADQGAKIINLSIGKNKVGDAFTQTIDDLAYRNILLTTAAGNDSKNCANSKVYPAAYDKPYIMSAAALALSSPKVLASYSNFGTCIDFALPVGDFGEGIISALWKGVSTYGPFNGTSAASPFLAGLAALVLSQYPELNAEDIKTLLISSTEKNERWGQEVTRWGVPRVDHILPPQPKSNPRWLRN